MQLSHYMKYRPSDSVQNIFENYAEFPQGHIMQQKRSITYVANYAISLEKISHRTHTVIRFTTFTTFKISEALHDVSNATM